MSNKFFQEVGLQMQMQVKGPVKLSGASDFLGKYPTHTLEAGQVVEVQQNASWIIDFGKGFANTKTLEEVKIEPGGFGRFINVEGKSSPLDKQDKLTFLLRETEGTLYTIKKEPSEFEIKAGVKPATFAFVTDKEGKILSAVRIEYEYGEGIEIIASKGGQEITPIEYQPKNEKEGVVLLVRLELAVAAAKDNTPADMRRGAVEPERSSPYKLEDVKLEGVALAKGNVQNTGSYAGQILLPDNLVEKC